MSSYQPQPLALAQATALVFLDKRLSTDATFIHGSPAMDDEIDAEILSLATQMYRGGETRNLVINGLTDQESLEAGKGIRLAYPGSDTWMRWFKEKYVDDVMMIPSSRHTAAESDALIALAKEKGWKSITIMSYPHHVLRCMLQMVFCLERSGSDLKVYTRTLPTIDWWRISKKGVLNGTPFEGKLLEKHMEEEYGRLIRYADKSGVDEEGKKFTPHATLEELIAYYKHRDSQ